MGLPDGRGPDTESGGRAATATKLLDSFTVPTVAWVLSSGPGEAAADHVPGSCAGRSATSAELRQPAAERAGGQRLAARRARAASRESWPCVLGHPCRPPGGRGSAPTDLEGAGWCLQQPGQRQGRVDHLARGWPDQWRRTPAGCRPRPATRTVMVVTVAAGPGRRRTGSAASRTNRLVKVRADARRPGLPAPGKPVGV